MKRSRAVLLIVGVGLASLAVGLAMVLVVVIVAPSVIVALKPVPPGPTSSVTGTTAAPSTGGRTADFTFGHTLSTVALAATGLGSALTQRVPFELDAQVTSMRLHVRNWSYIDDTPLPGDIDISAIAIGKAASGKISGDSSAFSSPPAVLSTGTTLKDGAEYTSDWLTADQVGFEPGVPFLLSMGWTSDAATKISVGWNNSWWEAGSQPGLTSTTSSIGKYMLGASFFDIWIEYQFTGDEKLVVVAGHSLNSGANGDPTDHPHDGEASAWHQIWANTQHGVASSLSAPGATVTQFGPDSPKWNIYPNLKPDIFVLWTASNDLALGEPVDGIRTAWLATVAKARSLWPGVEVVAFTEPPRGLTGQNEQNRLDWNSWLLTVPSSVDRVVDIDAVVRDPSNPSVLDPSVNGDGAHMSPQGNAEVASSFACGVIGC